MAIFSLKSTPSVSLALTALMLAGCAGSPAPIQEMSDARQSIEAAQNTGITENTPNALVSAEQLLIDAQDGIRQGDYDKAQKDAMAAKEAAHAALAIMTNNEPQPPPQVLPVTPPPAEAKTIQYTVNPGDNLWSLASRKEFYGDPNLWPLILKENAKQIHDADMLKPGQTIVIKLTPSLQDQTAASEYAALRHNDWPKDKLKAMDNAYLKHYGLR